MEMMCGLDKAAPMLGSTLSDRKLKPDVHFIGVARILSGVHLFPTKIFLVVASKRRSKTTNSSSKSS